MEARMDDGESLSWKTLQALNPESVCRRSGAQFDAESRIYTLTVLGQEIHAELNTCEVSSQNQQGSAVIEGFEEYSRVAVLQYLINARDISETGVVILPGALPGGTIFTQGAHQLPLGGLVRKYGENPEDFYSAGAELGGTKTEFGDMGLKVYAFPKIPIFLTLWKDSEEFPGEGTCSFDSSIQLHLPGDVIWATAMMTISKFMNI